MGQFKYIQSLTELSVWLVLWWVLDEIIVKGVTVRFGQVFSHKNVWTDEFFVVR